MGEEDDDVLREVVKIIIRSRNEFWSSNITSTLLYTEAISDAQAKQLAEQWLFIARRQLRKEIGAEMISKKIAQLRKQDREQDGVIDTLGYAGRKKTVIDIEITKEDEDNYVQKLQKDLEENQRRSHAARNTYRDMLNEKLAKARASRIEKADQKHLEAEKTLLNLNRDHTMFIDKRKSQADLQKDRISRMITQKKREKTMTIERKSQQMREKTFIDRVESEDMEQIAAKLQQEANQEKEHRASEVIPPKMTERENTDDAINNGEGELVEETDALNMVREKTFARKERKKKNRSSQKEKTNDESI